MVIEKQKRKKNSALLIRTGSLKTSLPYGWHCSASRRSSDWLFSSVSITNQSLQGLFLKKKKKSGLYWILWWNILPMLSRQNLYASSNTVGWTNETMILLEIIKESTLIYFKVLGIHLSFLFLFQRISYMKVLSTV